MQTPYFGSLHWVFLFSQFLAILDDIWNWSTQMALVILWNHQKFERDKCKKKSVLKLDHPNFFIRCIFWIKKFLLSIFHFPQFLEAASFWSDIAHNAPPPIMAMPTLKWLINWYLKPAHRVLLTNCIAAKAQDVTVHDGLKKTNNLQTSQLMWWILKL